MGNPWLPTCTATHYPWLIDQALSKVRKAGDVHLSQEAQDVLYRYGTSHMKEFQQALTTKHKATLGRLPTGLAKRMRVALDRRRARESL